MTGQTSLYITDLITSIDFFVHMQPSFIHSFIQTDNQTDSQTIRQLVYNSTQLRILNFFKGDEETKGSRWVEVNILERTL